MTLTAARMAREEQEIEAQARLLSALLGGEG